MAQDSKLPAELISSDPNFEITSTLNYCAGLPDHPGAPDNVKAPVSHCYLLQCAVDRLHAAAVDFSWSQVATTLEESTFLDHLSKEIETHLKGEYDGLAKDKRKSFIVRLAFKRDGALNLLSMEIPVKESELYFPSSLPDPLLTENARGCSTTPIYVDPAPTTPSLFTKHKTTHRENYNASRKRSSVETASPAECDVLLWNESREIMGAAFQTLYFWRGGRWVTPSSGSGCKLGVSRRWALENGVAAEATVKVDSLTEGEVIWCSTAVVGFMLGRVTLKVRGQ